MQSSNTPTKIPVPFADSGTKNTIPIPSQISVTPGAASFTTGFPPLTFTPIAAGGVPPFGADFNGTFNAITQCLRWANAGGQYLYDSAFSTSVGGYPKGALLQKATLDGFWLNSTDNNATNPDTGGAGWVDPLSGRFLNVQVFSAAGTSTYTPTLGTKLVVVEVLGPGGGSAATAATSGLTVSLSSGGGGGVYAVGRFTSGFAGVTVTVGAGGTGAPMGNVSPGGNGGTSSFGSLISASGGNGGQVSVAISTSATGGSTRAAGGAIVVGANIYSATGGASSFGPAGSVTTAGGDGGASGKGGGGARAGDVQNQVGSGSSSPGVNKGSGAGGAAGGTTTTSQPGAKGADGEVIVWEYA